jgi:hypothetical protein
VVGVALRRLDQELHFGRESDVLKDILKEIAEHPAEPVIVGPRAGA